MLVQCTLFSVHGYRSCHQQRTAPYYNSVYFFSDLQNYSDMATNEVDWAGAADAQVLIIFY